MLALRPAHGLRPALASTASVALVLGTAACSSSGAEAQTRYDIKAGNTTCDVEKTSFAGGEVAFKVQNTGTDVTEVYVYAEQGGSFTKIIGEVENIGPGTSRDLTVSLSPGSYQVACKPGMTGVGLRTEITVTGQGCCSGSSVSQADGGSATSAGETTHRPPSAATTSRAAAAPTSAAASTTTSPTTPSSADSPTKSSHPSARPSSSSALEQDSFPQRASEAQIPAAKLPPLRPQWRWDSTARLQDRLLRDRPSPCMRSNLMSIGAVREVGRTFSSSSAPRSSTATQLTAVFPDEHTALTAAAVLAAWHDDCVEYATATGLRPVSVRSLRAVPTPVGTGEQWMVTAPWRDGRPHPRLFISQGFVRDGDTITLIVYSTIAADSHYPAGAGPIDRALVVAARYLLRSR